ncbi:MAG: hypothetical protein WD398_11150 [Cyclobacteriaceae bacterium]
MPWVNWPWDIYLEGEGGMFTEKMPALGVDCIYIPVIQAESDSRHL